MIPVVSDYRGHRIEVNAVAVTEVGCGDAEVRVRRLFSQEKSHVDIVTCLTLTASHAEARVRDMGAAVDRRECRGGQMIRD